jgi:hypothetical protein
MESVYFNKILHAFKDNTNIKEFKLKDIFDDNKI